MAQLQSLTPQQQKELAQQKAAVLQAKIEGYYKQPWSLYQQPFQIADNLYYVGNRYVASYLLDTGAGLVLVDCGFTELLYQLIHNLHLLHFAPQDIRYVFLSHAHFDHCGATGQLQQMSGAEVYLGADDVFFFQDRRDLIVFEDRVPEFEISGTYDYSQPWTIGNTIFRFVHTPGHTPGCTTILMDTTLQGEPVTCAMHGGLGLNGLTHFELEANRLPARLHQDFYDQLVMCRTLKVDIPCPSHNHDYDILSLAQQDDGSHQIFRNPSGWRELMDRKIEQYLPIL